MISCQQLYSKLEIRDFTPIIKSKELDLFRNDVVRRWHNFFLREYEPSKPLAFLLPCTSIKPYSRSATHKLAYSILKRKGVDNMIQVYSVSEPMLLVPRELEECYPFNSYDYSPKLMSREEKEEFIGLLRKPLKKIANSHKVIVGVLPSHHHYIVNRASKEENLNLTLFSYGKLAFRSIHDSIDSLIKMGVP